MCSAFERRIFSILVAVGLSGCGALPSVGGAPAFVPQASAAHAKGAASWMLPDAKRQKLLYVSDPGTNDVYVYAYPKGTLVGTLTGFDELWGLCSDRAGNVFIADVWNYRLIEYAHGGATPVATLNDDGGHPTNCAIDPSTGNLAATFYFLSGSHRKSEVAIYAGAKSSLVRLGSKIGDGLWACTYDEKGNLFVDGIYGRTSTVVGLAELRKGHHGLTNLSLGTWVQYLSGIQWADGYLAIADQSQGSHEATIYRLSLHGRKTAVAGTTEIDGTQGVEQFWGRRGIESPHPAGTPPPFVFTTIREAGARRGRSAASTLPLASR